MTQPRHPTPGNHTAVRQVAAPRTADTTGTLRHRVLHELRQAIFDGRYRAGQKLIERELGDLTGASRSVLREVLASLEATGLVERESYRGYRVARLGAHKVSEIFELRESLETQAVELFAERASEAELDQLAAAFEALQGAVNEGETGAVRSAKEQYYDVLFNGCRNEEIRNALSLVMDRVFYLRSQLLADPDRRLASLEEFRRLTASLRQRDRLAARAACLDHLDAARATVLQFMAHDPEAPAATGTGSSPARTRLTTAGEARDD